MTFWQSARVIARRDYVATVLTRNFLLFLCGPLLAVGFGLLIGWMSGDDTRSAPRPQVVVIANAEGQTALRAGEKRLRTRIDGALPGISYVLPQGDVDVQARAILGGSQAPAAEMVMQWPSLHMFGSRAAVDRWRGPMRLIADETPQLHMGGNAASAQDSPVTLVAPVRRATPKEERAVARSAQTLVFMLTLLLASLSLSNMVEEKSNKVIEVLAAAMSIDAVFMGKLLAMLGAALTGILVWGGAVVIAAATVLPAVDILKVPPLGWPVSMALIMAYFITNYLLVGGLFLGIGAQAASVRDIQTIALPTTMMQMLFYALAGAAVSAPTSGLGIAALIFPLSSPLAAIAWAADSPSLAIHVAALAWQMLWVALVIRIGAAAFRRGVLKSGGQNPRHWWQRRFRSAPASRALG